MADMKDVHWHDLKTLTLEGKGWSDTEGAYDRLPARAKGVVREPVWNLSKQSAGVCARFVTDATEIFADWTVTGDLASNHMPATGVSGLDLYVRVKGEWRWIGVGRPEKKWTRAPLVQNMKPGRREYMLYLPLYNGTESVSVGVPLGAKLVKASPRPKRMKPICFYGTSIVQGGCASRPGMAYPAVLGRRLDRPAINLGFSGNGQLEPEVAGFLAELDPCVYVLDALPNVVAGQVRERLEPFVMTLRRAHPKTPIVLVENVTYQNAFLVTDRCKRYLTSNEANREVYRRMLKSGAKGLHCVPGGKLLGSDGEATVDGTHATDVGFLRMASVLEPVLRRLV
jgi:hypothetical protein